MADENRSWELKGLDDYRAKHAQESRALWEMSPAQRQAAMWRGELSSYQLFEWAGRKPSEVPLINDEFAFLAWSTEEFRDHVEQHERDR
jgi:hypothetical protein